MDSKGSELYELKRLGATPTRNSGRGQFSKGDGIIDLDGDPLVTIDVKEYAESFPISIKTWAKISTDAKKNSNSEPMFHLALGEDPKVRIAVISESFFIELIECYKEKYE